MDIDSLINDVNNLLNNKSLPVCKVGNIKNLLSKNDANSLENLLQSKIPIIKIAELLRSHNFELGNTVLAVHRRKQCICFRNL